MKLTNQINSDRLKVQSDSVTQVLGEGRGYRGSSKLEYIRSRQHLDCDFNITLGNTRRLLEVGLRGSSHNEERNKITYASGR